MIMRVGLTRIGSVSHVDLLRLASRLNRAGQEYQFEVVDPVDILGDHDEHGQYPLEQLVKLARMRLRQNLDFMVGVTGAPITGGYFSDVDPNQRAIIVSTNDMEVFVRNAQREIEDYVILEIAANLGAYEHAVHYPEQFVQGKCVEPWHLETRHCLFDYCINRQDIVEKLRNSTIDDVCIGTWRKKNLPERKLVALIAMVNKAMKLSLGKIIERVFRNPLVSILFGGFAFSGLSSLAEGIWGGKARLYVFLLASLGLGMAVLILYLKARQRPLRMFLI